MEEYQLPFTAFQLQHRRRGRSDGLLLAIKGIGLLEPGRNPGRFTVLMAVDITQTGFHGFGNSEGSE